MNGEATRRTGRGAVKFHTAPTPFFLRGFAARHLPPQPTIPPAIHDDHFQ